MYLCILWVCFAIVDDLPYIESVLDILYLLLPHHHYRPHKGEVSICTSGGTFLSPWITSVAISVISWGVGVIRILYMCFQIDVHSVDFAP